MSSAATASPPELLRRLGSVCEQRELQPLARRMAELTELIAPDLTELEGAGPILRERPSAVERSAHHLLARGGKRLRPMCVALAARLGTGFDARALELAVAVELVHAATLLHDDVVDLGETRRGAPAARVVYGNAVSVFAGDWLLVEALRRVRHAGVGGALERLLEVLDQMILAESLQLERRGRLETTTADWLAIVDGKTAALFRWAVYAGGRAGGLDEASCHGLERYGRHLGIAFQAIDDLLDLSGDPDLTGKALFADVREGKLTYPMLVALEREPALRELLTALLAGPLEHDGCARIARLVAESGALELGRALALDHVEQAKSELDRFPSGPARDALVTLADATVRRAA